MTFLIFIASVGILEYLLRRNATKERKDAPVRQPEWPAETPGSAGLQHLGVVLEQHGRGRQPDHKDGYANAPARSAEKGPSPIRDEQVP